VFVIPDRSIQEHGGILKDFTIEGQQPQGFVVLGVDLARTSDWTVLYGCNSHNRRNCYFERLQDVSWPEQKRRIRRAVSTMRRKGATDVLIMVDSTGVGDPIYEDLSNDGFDVVGINFTTHKQNMVRLLAKDVEESAAFLLPERLVEFEDYMMEMTDAGRMKYHAPEGAGNYDDVVSAKMLQHWGLINEAVGDIQVLDVSADVPIQKNRAAVPSDDPDADDGYELASDDYSDWLDPELEYDDEEADQMIGVESTGALTVKLFHPPTPEELLKRGVGFH
jgi:hypothetical protein